MADGDQQNLQGDGAGQGNGGAAWTAQLRDDLKSNQFFNQYQTVSDLGKWSLEADGKIKDAEGKLSKALFVPGEKASEDEVKAFRTKLGVPDKADAYDLKIEGAELPQGMTVKAEHEAWFRGMAHKLGLNPSQAKTVFTEGIKNLFVEPLKAQMAERVKAQESGMTALKTEWGSAFDENTTLVDRAIKQFGTPELQKELDDSGRGNSPALVKAFLAIGKAMAEDKFVTGGAAGDKRKPGELYYPSMQK